MFHDAIVARCGRSCRSRDRFSAVQAAEQKQAADQKQTTDQNQGQGQDQWRYTLHNGEWWYWLPPVGGSIGAITDGTITIPRLSLGPLPPALLRPVGRDRAKGVRLPPTRISAHFMAMLNPI